MDTDTIYDFIVIGGGASGFFGAINLGRLGQNVIILEKFHKVLTKVAVSGGGRCNVTHNQYEPKKLISSYPRGDKALLGPFHKFNPEDMIAWLENAGVKLKVEDDGRMFPTTDSSQTIIDCFTREAQKAHVLIEKGVEVTNIVINSPISSVETTQGTFLTKNILIASGSSKSIWEILKKLGHTIIEPSPSLFALNTPGSLFSQLPGLALKEASVSFGKHHFTGPLLFTHGGLSGPAVLKLSSFAALDLKQVGYKATVLLDLCPMYSYEDLEKLFFNETKSLSQITLGLPKRLWDLLITHLKLDKNKPLNHLSKAVKRPLIDALKKSEVAIDGKTTHKEEFVTAGGVDLKEVNFATMQSKLYPQLYFAGEVLNIDGITGGFNFQAAWTTSYLVSASLTPK